MPEKNAAAAPQKKSNRATKELLRGKRRRQREVTLTVDGQEVTVLMEAVPQKELEKLREKCPPTTKQRAAGASVNFDTFAPELVAACMVEPEMSLEEVRELWESPDWSEGELSSLFTAASNLCMEGLDIPFSDRG